MSPSTTAERVERFLDAAMRSQAVVHGMRAVDEAVALVCERVLAAAGDDGVAVPSRDPLMERLDVNDALSGAGVALVAPDHPDWREAVATCRVGVTGSAAGVAETGTVALSCGPGVPRAVSLLPDVHVCLVAASSVVDRFEDALPMVLSDGLAPNLVWVTGPSRSADIEKQITLGVHGPRTVEIVVADV